MNVEAHDREVCDASLQLPELLPLLVVLHEPLHNGGRDDGELVAEDERLQVLQEGCAGERVRLEGVPHLVEQELDLVEPDADVDARRDDLVEVFGKGAHAALLGEVLCEGHVEELLEDPHQPEGDVRALTLLRAAQTNFKAKNILFRT